MYCLPKVQRISLSDHGIKPREEAKLGHFVDGGLTVFRNCLFHTLICHHELGQLGKGGHNHVDSGHFILSYKGTQILGDPGSFSYNKSKEERDSYRQPFAHNMMLYKEEKFDLSKTPNFSLPDFFQTKVLSFNKWSNRVELAIEVTSIN
jgi:hypothetical protein